MRTPSAPRRGAGFTLVELMVVLVIIALLLTIAVPRYFGAVENGKRSVQRQNIAAIRDAIDKYRGDQGSYPQTLDDLVEKKYLRAIPVDPLTGRTDWIPVPPADPDVSGIYDVRSPSAATSTAPDAAADGSP